MAPALEGKHILITGASRGIGKALAQGCLDAGAGKVVGTATSAASWQTPASDERFAQLILDQGEPESIATFSKQLSKVITHLDGVVHNAAILGEKGDLASFSPDLLEEVLRVNVTGIVDLNRTLIPLMERAPAASMVLFSSGVGRTGKPGSGAYGISKFGVEGMMQIYAEELADQGIRVNTYNPGPTRTDMRAAYKPEEDPLTIPPPESHIDGIVWLLGEASKGRTGEAFDYDQRFWE